MRGRTDLAVEMKEEIQSDEPIRGVHVMTKNNGDTDIKEVRIVVENEQGAMQLGKPVGHILHWKANSFEGRMRSFTSR